MTLSAASGTAPSRVSIGVSVPSLPGGGLTPGTFVGELIFQSASGTVTVPVTVVVGDNVFRQVNALSFTKPVERGQPAPTDSAGRQHGHRFSIHRQRHYGNRRRLAVGGECEFQRLLPLHYSRKLSGCGECLLPPWLSGVTRGRSSSLRATAHSP